MRLLLTRSLVVGALVLGGPAAFIPDTVAAVSAEMKFWLNTDSGIRHNSKCKYFGKTKGGRYCPSTEGKACKLCGG